MQLLDAPTARPRRQLAILTCMDARIDVFEVLDLGKGDAHVIRNAGAVATDDASLLILSQQALGTATSRSWVIRLRYAGLNSDELRERLKE